MTSGLSFLAYKNDRREVRRRVSLSCRVVRESDFRLLGTHAIDLSPDGMCVMSIRDAEPGESLVVTFKATELGLWFDAEATIARVLRGRRPTDRGRCLGVSFTNFDPVSRLILRHHLRRTAPPVPQRSRPIDYAATVKRIALGA
jgi:hypothetical protein